MLRPGRSLGGEVKRPETKAASRTRGVLIEKMCRIHRTELQKVFSLHVEVTLVLEHQINPSELGSFTHSDTFVDLLVELGGMWANTQ